MTSVASERKNVLISLWIPKQVLNEIDELVKQGRVFSRSEAIRQAITYYLLRFKEKKENYRLWMGP